MSELPRGWVQATLGDLFEITSSKRVHQHEWTESGVPFYRAREVKKLAREGYVENELFISEELFQKYAAEFGAPIAGDLMVTAVGTLGECYRVTQADRFYFKDASVLWFRSEGKADSEFITRIFSTREVRAQVHKGGGTTVGTYTIGSAKETVVPLPPLVEQKRIVAKLDALNAKSARARTDLARIETLVSRYKQAVLSKAFSGELARKDLGELVARIKAGKNLRCEERPPHPHEKGVVKVSAVTWGEFRADQSKTLPPDFEPDEDARIKDGDFLFSRANTIDLVGAVVMVVEAPDNLYLSDKILRLEFTEQVDAWVLWYLRSPMGREALMNISSGNQLSMRNIGQKSLLSLSIPYADAKLRNEIIRRIEAAFAKIDRLAAEGKRALELVSKLDEAILAKAFRGELVPQDENDAPAEHLLARTAPSGRRRRRPSAGGERRHDGL